MIAGKHTTKKNVKRKNVPICFFILHVQPVLDRGICMPAMVYVFRSAPKSINEEERGAGAATSHVMLYA